MSTVADRLKNFWAKKDREAKFEPGVSEDALRAFEQKNGIVLPNDFRNFLKAVNGYVFDQNMITFHSLEKLEIQKIDNALPAPLCIFADYSIYAYSIGFELRHRPNEPTPVYAYFPNRSGACLNKIGDSFTDFADLCIYQDVDSMTFWAQCMELNEETLKEYRAKRNARSMD